MGSDGNTRSGQQRQLNQVLKPHLILQHEYKKGGESAMLPYGSQLQSPKRATNKIINRIALFLISFFITLIFFSSLIIYF